MEKFYEFEVGNNNKERYYSPQRPFSVLTLNSAFIDNVGRSFYFSGEIHNFWELVFIIDGNMISTEDDRLYELNSGQLVLHAPMEFHRIWTNNSESARFMIISFATVGTLPEQLKNGVFSLSSSHIRQLNRCFEAFTSTFTCDTVNVPLPKGSSTPYDEQEAVLLLELFLLSLAFGETPENLQLSTKGAEHYKKVINVLTRNIDANLSVEDISKESMIGRSSLKKLFQKFAGCGVMEYYNKMRIVRACELLRQGRSVLDVCSLMNYSSPGYFSIAFKREMGVPPSVYKNMNNYR